MPIETTKESPAPVSGEWVMVPREDIEGIINAMTAKERRQPALLMDGKSKASRKRRIAQGAGVQIQDVNRLLNQFDQMQSMMKKMKGGGLFKMMKRMGGMKGLPGMGR